MSPTATFLIELDRLPIAERTVLVLRFFDDLTEAETAATLGCSPVLVQSWVSRGLEGLRAGGWFDHLPDSVPGPESRDG